MKEIELFNEKEEIALKTEMRESIFENIREHEVFGKTNQWQEYMVREVYYSYPPSMRGQLDLIIDELKREGILSINENGYLTITSEGEELVYESDYYDIDEVSNKILIYLRDNNYYANTIWKLSSYRHFYENELCVYEKRLFDLAIQQLLSLKNYSLMNPTIVIFSPKKEKTISIENKVNKEWRKYEKI